MNSSFTVSFNSSTCAQTKDKAHHRTDEKIIKTFWGQLWPIYSSWSTASNTKADFLQKNKYLKSVSHYPKIWSTSKDSSMKSARYNNSPLLHFPAFYQTTGNKCCHFTSSSHPSTRQQHRWQQDCTHQIVQKNSLNFSIPELNHATFNCTQSIYDVNVYLRLGTGIFYPSLLSLENFISKDV